MSEQLPNSADQDRSRNIWKSIFGWSALFRWDAMGAIVPGIFLAVGFGMLGIDWFPAHLVVSEVSFGMAGALCIVKVIGHAVETDGRTVGRVLFAVLLSALVLVITVPTEVAIEHHRREVVVAAMPAPAQPKPPTSSSDAAKEDKPIPAPQPSSVKSATPKANPKKPELAVDGPSFPAFKEKVSDEVYVKFGNTTIICHLGEMHRKPCGVPFVGEVMNGKSTTHLPITVKLEDNKLLFSFVASGGMDGQIAIQVVDNEIVSSEGDLNSNGDALEVVDNNGRVVFQMIRAQSNRIEIFGMFNESAFLAACASENNLSLGSPQPTLSACHIDPMFKHPAWKYRGQLVK